MGKKVFQVKINYFTLFLFLFLFSLAAVLPSFAAADNNLNVDKVADDLDKIADECHKSCSNIKSVVNDQCIDTCVTLKLNEYDSKHFKQTNNPCEEQCRQHLKHKRAHCMRLPRQGRGVCLSTALIVYGTCMSKCK